MKEFSFYKNRSMTFMDFRMCFKKDWEMYIIDKSYYTYNKCYE